MQKNKKIKLNFWKNLITDFLSKTRRDFSLQLSHGLIIHTEKA